MDNHYGAIQDTHRNLFSHFRELGRPCGLGQELKGLLVISSTGKMVE